MASRSGRSWPSGGYVSDEITNAIVADRLSRAGRRAGFLLDGYPRTLHQVETLDAALAESGEALDAVISLVADTDEVVDRLLKRAELEGRADDNDERSATAWRSTRRPPTAPRHYRDRGLLVEVDGIGGIEEVAGRITAALDAKLG